MAATLPVAPLTAIAYLLSEWVFFVTKPSPLAGLPLTTELAVLLRSPLNILLPLLCVQAIVSVASGLGSPHLRWLAIVPGAMVGGVLLLQLIDNFTYTLFGFGVLTVGLSFRLIYAALLFALVACAGWTLAGWAAYVAARRHASMMALGLTALLTLVPVVEAPSVAVPADLNAPPASVPIAGGGSDHPNVLFLGLDGLDAPLLSAYGYARPTTPFLEIVRDQSLFFENAFANVGRTHGSLVTLLTGRLPFTTHVTFPPTVLQGEDAHRHLPAFLKSLGYAALQLGMRHFADAEDANLLGFDAANYRWQRVDQKERTGPSDEADAFRIAVAERLDERLGQLFGVRHAINGFAYIEGRQESPYWRDERRVSTLLRYFSSAPQPWFVHVHLLDTHCCNFEPSRQSLQERAECER